MAPTVDFYFDFASPYGYFTALRIDDLVARHGAQTIWRPILLGAVFKVTGMKPNIEQPLRSAYFTHDVARIARAEGCRFTFPARMPVNALAASRAYWWLFAEDPAAAKRLALALYDAHWGEGRDIAPPETVIDIGRGLGLDTGKLSDGLQNPVVKDRLRDETDRAIARGVFGSPFIMIGDEPFWGWDRLDMALRWLASGGW